MAKVKKKQDYTVEWMSVREAKDALGVHEVTFRRWILEHKVEVLRVKTPRKVLVSRKWLAEQLNNNFKVEKQKRAR